MHPLHWRVAHALHATTDVRRLKPAHSIRTAKEIKKQLKNSEISGADLGIATIGCVQVWRHCGGAEQQRCFMLRLVAVMVNELRQRQREHIQSWLTCLNQYYERLPKSHQFLPPTDVLMPMRSGQIIQLPTLHPLAHTPTLMTVDMDPNGSMTAVKDMNLDSVKALQREDRSPQRLVLPILEGEDAECIYAVKSLIESFKR